jgi:ABC-2 type transport system ATP-binding protein
MLQVKNLVKLYNENGVSDVSFTLEKGQVCAIVGHNGSGKSTLFKLLLGLISQDSGEIITSYSKKISMGYLPENRSVIADLKTEELINFLGELKGMTESIRSVQVEYWLKELQCKDLVGKRLRQCSKGNQQKIQLICSLIHNPDIIILDEPFSGLDLENTRLFQKIIIQLKKQGKCILLSSHRFEDIEHLCDYLLVLRNSRVVIQGSIHEIRDKTNRQTITVSNDPLMSYRDEKGVVNVAIDGNLTHYMLLNEKHSARLVNEIIKERNHRTVKMASLTLFDLISINERTH